MKLPSHFVRNLLLCMVLSIVFYAVWAALGGLDEVLAAAGSLGWQGWALILGLSLLNYGLRFLRWDIYLRRLGHAVPAGRNLSAYLAGFGFTATPGKFGEAIRSVYLKPFGVSYMESLAAFFVERLVDLLAMVVVASMAAIAFESMRWLVGATFLASLVVIPLVHSRRLLRWLAGRAERSHSGRLSAGLRHLVSLLGASSALLRSVPLYAGFLLGLLAWFAEGFALYVVLDRMGTDVPVLLAAGIYGISILAGVVSFVPGGLGGTELVMGSLLVLAGVDGPVAVSAVIICRVATLWFAVAIGLIFLAVLEAARLPGEATAPETNRMS